MLIPSVNSASPNQVSGVERILQITNRLLRPDFNLAQVLGQGLMLAAEAFHAPLVEYFSHAETVAYLGLSYWQGRLLTPAAQPEHPGRVGLSFKVEDVPLEPVVQPIHSSTGSGVAALPVPPLYGALGPGDAARWYTQRGLGKALYLPLVFNQRAIGALWIYGTAGHSFPPSALDLGKALAPQLSLAIQMRRLTKVSALARRREQAAQGRIAELSRANQVLRASLSQLADEPDLEKFLGHVLMVCTERFGALEAGIWRFEEGLFRLFISYEEGKVKLDGDISHPGANLEVAKEIRNHVALEKLKKREIICDYEEDFASRPLYALSRDYLRQRGIKAALKIPLFLDDHLRGILVLRFQDRYAFQPGEAELAFALGNQAALALELTRLAADAKQIALARRSEQTALAQKEAAQQRAAEFSRANEILSDSLGYLATNPDLHDVLGHLLVEAVRYAHAAIGHIFLYNASQDTLTLTVRCRDGTTHWEPAVDEPDFLRSPIPATPIFGFLRHQPRLSIINREQFEGTLCAPTIDWLSRAGYQTQARCVLSIGEQPVGLMLMAFEGRGVLSPLEQELILALARQIALVIQLTHLAKVAQTSAIVEERNRMARDIHDTLAQAFTSILMRLQTASLALADGGPVDAVQANLDRASDLAREGLANARLSVQALRPRSLNGRSLGAALADSLQQMTEGTTVQGSFQQFGSPVPLTEMVELELFRIAQEAITNSCKHAQATTLVVQLAFGAETVHLSVQDDGIGFALTESTTLKGFGLVSMQQRTERIGGHLSITSAESQGTTISVMVPLELEPPHGPPR
ncbi:MAG: GAF domain-containing sensor histidine kinase [Nodosilinea sp.]